MLLIGRERGKGQIGKIPGPSPSKSGKSQKNRERTKKDKKGRTSPDRETPPFETPPLLQGTAVTTCHYDTPAISLQYFPCSPVELVSRWQYHIRMSLCLYTDLFSVVHYLIFICPEPALAAQDPSGRAHWERHEVRCVAPR